MMKLVGCLVTLSLLTLCYAKDYCSLCRYHTMCGTTNEGKKCLRKIPMSLTASDKQEILDTHNKLRNKVATGSEFEGSTGPMPSAANMMKMEWDDELATMAQRLADQCVDEMDCGACRLTRDERFIVGQRIFVVSDSFWSLNFVRMVEDLYNTISLMSNTLVDSFAWRTNVFCTQLIWWNSRLLGCGASLYIKDGSEKILLVCNYGSYGDIVGAKIYQKGTPASQCPKGTAKDSTFPGLCALQSKPANGKFPETDDKLLGLPPQYRPMPTRCQEKGFRV